MNNMNSHVNLILHIDLHSSGMSPILRLMKVLIELGRITADERKSFRYLRNKFGDCKRSAPLQRGLVIWESRASHAFMQSHLS
jgi:hypothetical protein